MRAENRSEIIHDALNMLDDEMIEEAEKIRRGELIVKKELRPWRKWVAIAASVCVLIVVGGVWNASLNTGIFHFGSGNIAFEEKNEMQEGYLDEEDDVEEECEKSESDESVIIPAMKVNLEKEDGVASDMAALFIYKGRCYVQTCDYITKDVVGDYVCTSTGLIDEWSTKDGYVELAGSVENDFYEVKGIDPAFMLCSVYENGVVETFIHNNGITLDKGSELLVDRLGLENDFQSVGFLTSKEWENQYKTKQKPTVISEEHRELFNQFIASFNEGDFILSKSLGMNRNEVYASDAMYHLYITTEEGVPLHFLLLGDGYVSFYGLNQVCLKVDEEVYDEIIGVLEGR